MIRRFLETDAQAFSTLRNVEAVARYQDWPFPFTTQDVSDFLTQMIHAHPDNPGEWFQFALIHRNTGTFVGDIGFHSLPKQPAHVEIGFSLHPESQGIGLMSEALRAMFDYLFKCRGKERVLAMVDSRNEASARLLKRVGFARERTLPADPEHADMVEYLYVLKAAQ